MCSCINSDNHTMTDKQGYPIRAGNVMYSIVIPVYRAAATINEVINRIRIVMDERKEAFEIICVDDGSPDESWSLLEKINDTDKRIRIIQLMRNVGQFRALMCGLRAVRGDFVITMDDDLQHPPEEIPKLIEYIQEKPFLDAVVGVAKTKKHSSIRNLGSLLLRKLNQKSFNVSSDLHMGSFRIIKKSVVDIMIENQSVNLAIGPLLLMATNRVENVMVEHHARIVGRSNYSPHLLIKTALDNIINYSTLPLTYICYVGLLIALAGFIFGCLVILKRIIYGVSVQGWATLVVLLCLFSGCILFVLGVIGEYLVRVIHDSNGEKQYQIRQSK